MASGAATGTAASSGGRVGDLDLLVDLDDVVAGAAEMVGQPRAHEAAAAGDQGAHDGSPYWLGARWCTPGHRAVQPGPGRLVGPATAVR